MSSPIGPTSYNEDYFENGPIVGVSGYMNYSWMPELTIRMAHKLVIELPITRGEAVLDFGCAKGFLVKALRILDVEASGVDVSSYAIENADGSVRDHCRRITGIEDPELFDRKYDWMIAKDVLEHLAEPELRILLHRSLANVKKVFVAVPLAADDVSGNYIVPDYDRDITHQIAKSIEWWTDTFAESGWRVDRASHAFAGCKENWTRRWWNGNGFFVLANA